MEVKTENLKAKAGKADFIGSILLRPCHTTFYPINNLPVNKVLSPMASNFWATNVAANYRRHAPPIKIQKSKENREKLF